MKKWHRTRLETKYRAVKLLSISIRAYGANPTPRFAQVARELEMTKQNLSEIWDNREAIIERAKRRLPKSVIESIDLETLLLLRASSLKIITALENKDFSKMSISALISALNSILDGLIALNMNK